MPTINNTIDIKATPDEVWAVLADMPATRQWLPGVVAARMDGNVRICEMADGQQVHEKISDVSAEQRSFRFEHVRVPLPVQRSSGTFTVTASGSAAALGLPSCSQSGSEQFALSPPDSGFFVLPRLAETDPYKYTFTIPVPPEPLKPK